MRFQIGYLVQRQAQRGEVGMVRGRAAHLKSVLASGSSGSSLEKRAAAGERLRAAKSAKQNGGLGVADAGPDYGDSVPPEQADD